MEFADGQVFKIEKISKHIKASKEKKAEAALYQKNLYCVAQIKEEIESLKSTLDNTCDTEAIQSSIYRLKAAELELNRFFRHAKGSQLKS